MAQNLNTVAVVNTTVAAAAKPARKARVSKKKSAAPLVLEHAATTTLGELVVGTMPAPGQAMLEALIGELDGAGPQDDEVIEPAAADVAPVVEVEQPAADTAAELVTDEPAVTLAADAAPAVIGADAKEIETPDDGLDALLSQLDALPVADTAAPAIETTLTDAEVESAVATIEVREAMLAAATPEGVIGSATPTGDASDVSADDLSAAASEGTADGAGVKRSPTPRKHWTDKVERLKDRMGDSMGEYSVLTLDDAGVDPEALKSRMEETLAIIKGMNKKEQARAGFLIEFVSGRKAKLNEVLDRTLQVLHKDGFISTGKDGNVLANLLARPYSPGAARAMGGNTIGMFEDLKLIKADGKGRYVANPDSTLLMKVNSMLFPAAVA